MPTTILVVEDEPAIQALIAVNLTFAGYQALQALDAQSALHLIRTQCPDLLLLDWMLPGTSGILLAKTLRSEERTRHLPIIMLTAKGAEADKIAGLDAGADDYITKPFSPRELLARIKAVLRRRAPHHTNDVICAGHLCLDPNQHRVTSGDHLLTLAPIEFRLLHFFMTHANRVFSREQLLDQVWGDHVFIEDRTIDVHIRRLRNALKPGGHAQHIETVRGAGYRFNPHPCVT